MTNIHKITFKHKTFLAQERKDPITGDTICEGDEVVFCGACKSVFLKDSWEYLGGQHCGQSSTLQTIPSPNQDLRFKERVLFYKQLSKNKSKTSPVPRLKSKYYIDKSKLVSSFVNLFYPKDSKSLFIALPVIAGIIFSAFYLGQGSWLQLLFWIVYLGYFVSRWLHDKFYKSRINATEFGESVFYISRKGIGFASKYGHNHLIPVEHINKILIKNRTNFFDHTPSCTIYYGNNHKVKFRLESVINVVELENLIRNLQVLTNQKNIPIELKFKDQYKKALIKRLLSEYRQTDSSILLIE